MMNAHQDKSIFTFERGTVIVKKRNLLLVFIFIVISFSGCGNSKKKPKEEDTIKLGTIQSMTGDISAFGISSKNGVMLAVKEINEKGGILGKKNRIGY